MTATRSKNAHAELNVAGANDVSEQASIKTANSTNSAHVPIIY